MTDTTRNVELVIRAKNLSKKTLSDVEKEIESINAALDKQVEASKKGQGSLKDLDKAYRDLDGALKSLSQQQSVILQFEKQQAALQKLEQQLAENQKRLVDHEAAMAASEKTTKRQAQQLLTYQKAVERSQTALDRQAERLNKVRVEGEGLGLAMNNLGEAQNKILATGRRLSDVYDKQAGAVDNFATSMAQANRVAQQQADNDAFARQAADAAKLVKAGDYVNFWVAELEKKEAVERKMAADRATAKAFDDEAASAARLVKASEYVNFWTNELNELDITQKRIAANDALNKMAQDAVAAARGYTTLGTATKRLVQNNNQLSKSIASIVDPSAQLRTTLGGVEEEVASLARSISAIRGPVADYRGQVSQLSAANKALAAQASSIDAYTRQIAALREARAQFVSNRAELLQYANAIRSADGPTEEMQATLRRLEGSLAASARNLQQQTVRARELRTVLREAGVSTSDLAGSQARLVQTARNSVGALNQLNAAVKRYGNEAEGAARSNNVFDSSGRTTLSLMQRIRGEVLALAAAYVGLQGTIGLANDSLNASNTKVGIQNQLALSVGDDPARIAEEYAYIREQADRIGVSFEEAAKGYAKFSAAASLAGRSNEEIRYVAESFLEVGRVANLSAADIDGVFKALEQMYSKGKIQAEELRGQLGDRLFGAFEIAAKALVDQFPNLDKAMKDGLITSDQLLAIAEQYRKTVANRLPTAMEGLAANQQRLNSAFFDFKVLIADSGFADQYERLVKQITVFLKSDDGRKFAENLSKAFGAVVTALSFLLENLDEVQFALELAFGLKAMTLVAGLASSISTQLIPAIKAMIPALTASGTAGVAAFGKIQTAFAALSAAFIGWQIGTYASEKFEIVRQLGVSLVIGLIKAFKQLEFAGKEVWVGLSTSWQDVAATLLNSIGGMFRQTLGILQKAAEAAGAEDIAGRVGAVIETITFKGSEKAQGEIAKLRTQLQKELAAVDAIGFDMFEAASDAARAADATAKSAADLAKATPKPTITPKATEDDGKAAKAYEKLVKKRIALADQLVRALEQAEAKIQRNDKLSLEQRLAAIDTEYAKVFRKIEALAKLPGGAQQAEQMRSTLQGYVQQLKVQETMKFNTEELARNEKTINDLISLRTQLLQNITNQQKAGLITEQQAKTAAAGVDAELNPQITSAVDAAKQFAMSNQQVFADQTAMDTYLAKLDGIGASLITVKDQLLSVDQANQILAGGLTGAFDQMAESIANGEDAVDAMKKAFLTFVADFLKKIALMIIQQIILNALQNSNVGGMLAGAVTSAGNSGGGAAQRHGGGLIGSGYGGVKVATNPSWFAGAPKYHTGGVVGLAADEYPAILQRNEEVLAANDPRNILNMGGAAAGGGAAAPQEVSIANFIDAESFMSAALSKSTGQKMIMNVLSANRSQLKTLINN